MTIRQQFLGIMKNNEDDFKKLFENLVLNIVKVISSYGNNLEENNRNIREQASELVTNLFLTRIGNKLVPFVNVNGKIIPVSPYAQILWPNIEKMVELAVMQQHDIMQKALDNYPEVKNKFLRASQEPVAEFTVKELTPPKFDPSRSWINGGYNLSDNIWQISLDARRKIDLYLDEAIRAGKSAEEISKDLTKFLLPDKQLNVTNKPYGRSASFEAMRLARTELTVSFGLSGLQAARNNPFITGYRTKRTANAHPCTVCDENEAGGPYSLDDINHIPGATHPFCMCILLWVMSEKPKETIQNIDNSLFNTINPLQPQRFINWLLSFFK